MNYAVFFGRLSVLSLGVFIGLAMRPSVENSASVSIVSVMIALLLVFSVTSILELFLSKKQRRKSDMYRG